MPIRFGELGMNCAFKIEGSQKVMVKIHESQCIEIGKNGAMTLHKAYRKTLLVIPIH